METSRNPQANYIIEQTCQVPGDVIQKFELNNNYVHKNDPWKGIPVIADFAIYSTFHMTK